MPTGTLASHLRTQYAHYSRSAGWQPVLWQVFALIHTASNAGMRAGPHCTAADNSASFSHYAACCSGKLSVTIENVPDRCSLFQLAHALRDASNAAELGNQLAHACCSAATSQPSNPNRAHFQAFDACSPAGCWKVACSSAARKRCRSCWAAAVRGRPARHHTRQSG
jgi:hypothetical protein